MVNTNNVSEKLSICDICKESIDIELWYDKANLKGLQELFGYTCSTCKAISESGGLMYLEDQD